MSESCGNPAVDTGEALMPSKPSGPTVSTQIVEVLHRKKSANLTDQKFASNAKLILGTW
jgi:hypothetical protein